MTKNQIIEDFTTALGSVVPSVGMDEELSQSDLTTVTDAGAAVLDTVNPNGPCYPSTPR